MYSECTCTIYSSLYFSIAIVSPFADWYLNTYLTKVGSLDNYVFYLMLLNGYIAIRMYHNALVASDIHSSNETVR